MPSSVLYQPQKLPQTLSVGQTGMLSLGLGVAQGRDAVSQLLGCAPNFVDVLARGHDYIAYSIFDGEGDINTSAMTAVAELTGESFDLDNEDHLLRGPVLVVTQS